MEASGHRLAWPIAFFSVAMRCYVMPGASMLFRCFAVLTALIPSALAASIFTSTAAAAPAPAPDMDKALAFSQAVVGSQLDDHQLIDSNGRQLHLSEFRGKPLLVQFIYTSCSQACPVSVKYLERGVRAARDALGENAFSAISVGFNVPFDTPQAMAAFAKRHGISDPHWHFAAGDARTIEDLTRSLGFTWYATPKGFDHIAQVSVLDSRGRVYRQVYGEQIDVPLLVEPLKQLVTGQQAESDGWRSFIEEVRLFCTVYDSASGRYRFDYSLFLQIIIGATVLGTVGFMIAVEWRKNSHGRDKHSG